MNRFLDWMENKLIPPLAKIANQRHLVAIRNGLVITLPVIIAGSLFLIVGNIPIESWLNFLEPYAEMIDAAVNATFGIIALLAAVGIGYELSQSYNLNGITGGALGLMAFVITQLSDEGFAIDATGFDSTGLFTAIVSGIIATEIYHLFVKKNWVIHLPDGVPPAVSSSFVSLTPAVLTLILFWIVRVPLHFNFNEFIQMVFSPILFALNTLPGILVYTLLVCLLWCAGIHGDMALEGVADPIFLQFVAANAIAYTNHQPLPYITASGFSSLFVNVGGTGATLTLVFLMLRSRSKTFRQLGKVSLPSGLFEINEPVIFGFPIIMNPLMMIPFILVPLILAGATFVVMSIGWVSAPVTVVPWTMPPIIGPLMATGWDWRAGLWSAIEIVIAVTIYMPFFKVAEKQMLATETTSQNDAVETKNDVVNN